MGTIPPKPPVIRPQRPTSYTCEYCRRNNPVACHTCEGCGAPRQSHLPHAIIAMPLPAKTSGLSDLAAATVCLLWVGFLVATFVWLAVR